MDNRGEKAKMSPVVEPAPQTGCMTLSICYELSLHDLPVVSQASVQRDTLPCS